jgi:hypothetical protein
MFAIKFSKISDELKREKGFEMLKKSQNKHPEL